MKRDLDAAHAPKVDQNLYYGMYYRFLDYSKRALSRIGEVSVATIYLPFPLLCVRTFHLTICQSRPTFVMMWNILIVFL